MMVKVFRRLKLVAFNKENLERTLGINNLRKRLDDIVKVRHFNDEMENKQIKFIYDLTVKNIKKEIDRGCVVTTEVEQVIRLAPCKVIGVTGSKGKTTTTTIIYNILKSLGYSTYLGGNIGTPLFVELDKMKNDDIVVLELSSFQLMNMKVSPSISVVTNISPDHLDVHSSYDEYINAKKYIFSNQEKQDVLVLNHDDEIVKNFYCDAIGEVRYFGVFDNNEDWNKNSYVLNGRYIEYNDDKIIDTKKFLLKGVHN